MKNAPLYIHDFRSLLPAVEKPQHEALNWLATAHTQSEAALNAQSSLTDRERIKKLFARFGCGPHQIERRFTALQDFEHDDFERMEIFHLARNPRGAGSSARTKTYRRIVNEAFEHFFKDESRAPNALIHVTCTGYTAPSGAERIVTNNGWGANTEVYHLYHMGCYAAIPTLRIAEGLGQSRVDIVHTELCSIHLDPSQHTPEQIVIQSLFADGLIRYSMCRELSDNSHALELLSTRKELVQGSDQAMTWSMGDYGMEMTLSREVPDLIAQNLIPFLKKIENLKWPISEDTLFAIHPGGPRIIDQIQTILNLSDKQVAASRKLLRERGNMSSATLPHIWMQMLADPNVTDGTLIVSLAFGPGLTLCANILRKVSS